MAYRIDTSSCISCGSCISECPMGAISENGGAHTIDAAVCIDCGGCAGICPMSAISLAE